MCLYIMNSVLFILIFRLIYVFGQEFEDTLESEDYENYPVLLHERDIDAFDLARYEGDSARNQDLKLPLSPNAIFNPCPGHWTGAAGRFFMDLINTLLMSQCVITPGCSYPEDRGAECIQKQAFDFIIVGGGTAGSVLAARLSENPSWNILLLEAGVNPSLTSAVPAFHLSLQGRNIDWKFRTEMEDGMFNGLMGRSNRWPRGKVLGGTSSINRMVYMRGNKRDYDNWAAEGNRGWAYEDVLTYFKKAEDMRDLQILNSQTVAKYHNTKGPQIVSRLGSTEPIIKVLQDGALELGYAPNFDMNGAIQTGFTSPNQGSIKVGERYSSARAYLVPARKRKNLFVFKYAFVKKILINNSTKKAGGVVFNWRKEDKDRTVKVTKEVILSAGTINTAKLLMLSGIGPRRHLGNHRIDVIQHLAVGKNLQDHVMFLGIPIVMDPVAPPVTVLDKLDMVYEYLTRRSGPLSNIGASELVGLISTDGDDRPDIQLHFVYSKRNTSTATSFLKTIGLLEDILLEFADMNKEGDLLLAVPVLLRPESSGTIMLRSCNPLDEPVITAGYFQDPTDLETMLKGIQFVLDLVKTEALQAFGAEVRRLSLPGCCDIKSMDERYWACALSHVAGTFYDPVGTTKMGPDCDPYAVVDNKLHVRGIQGLRVGDLSIMPKIISGYTAAAAQMIGEKLSDMIKENYTGMHNRENM